MSKPTTKNTTVIFCIALAMCFLNSNFSIAQINAYWQLGGNNSTTTFPFASRINAASFIGSTDPNIPLNLKTTQNQPMLFFTNNTQRLFLSPNVAGRATTIGVGTSFNAGYLPRATMHLQTDDANSVGGGYRTWMTPSSGTTNQNPGLLIGNADNIWLGLRNKGGYDLNDAILNWGDNSGTAAQGADFFRFTFTHWDINNQPGGTTDGLEIMRFAPNSYVGIGDFQISNIFNPQSKLHIHEDYSLHPGGGNGQSVWFQMTNNDFAPTPTANDGLRVGVLYQPNLLQTGNAFIYNQEDRHLIFSTNHATPDGAGSINNTNERMRITSIGAPTKLITGYGVYNPSGTANTDFTRVAISLNPFNPIHRPLSLLHLGYGANSATTNLDGWRPWMDIGTFTNSDQGSSMYSGLKQSGTNDAVIGWGYVPSNQGAFATRMRVLFTTNSNVTTIAGSTNGIEAAHFWSDGNNTRMGVGDMQTPNVDPQNTLEIRSSAASTGFGTINGSSGLRFTNLLSSNTPITNPTNGVLSVNANGDVILVADQLGSGSFAGAQNGATNTIYPLNPTGKVQFGQFIGQGGSPGQLLDSREVPMNGHNVVFTGSGFSGQNRFGIGTSIPTVKLEVNTSDDVSAGKFITTTPAAFTTAGIEVQSSGSSVGNVGVKAATIGVGMGNNTAIDGFSNNSTNSNTGGRFEGISGVTSFGVAASASGASYNYAVSGIVNGSTGVNYGVYGSANSGARNYGVVGRGNVAALFPNADVGVLAFGSFNDPTKYGGYFRGDLFCVGNGLFNNGVTIVSDITFKREITTLTRNLDIIQKLKPSSYFMTSDGYDMHFSNKRQYGFIAQEVMEIIPDAVIDIHQPQMLDSTGVVVFDSVSYKGLNYNAFIPFAIGGIQELNQKQQEILKSLEKLGLSDAQVKTNVSSFSALNKIKQLSPVSYNFTNTNVPQLSFTNATDYGFVAQQLETVYPELVDTVRIAETLDSLGNIQNPSVLLKTVNYKAMSALLTRAVQEQQLTIDSLKQAQNNQDSINNSVQNQLAQLTASMNSCCQNTNSRTYTTANNTVIDVELSDKDIIVLNQNVPNPFAEQTTIAYNVPEKAGFAQIIFNDMKGQIIKVVDIKTKGKGQLNVFANDLSTGMYTYSLYVDGKLIDTKKMVKTE